MHDSLNITLILLTTAVLVVVLFRRINMPAILGYLMVGVIIGPHALGWVPDTAETRYLAEIGVVFLMFSIGLEFSLAQLMTMRRLVLGLGGAQVSLTMIVALAIGMAAGLNWQASLILGGVVAMSSTAIISKVLSDSLQLHSAHGRQIMGVLLFQDLAVVPLLVLIPALALPADAMAAAVSLALLKAAVVLTLILFVGQRVMRPLFTVIAAQKSSELFVLAVLLVTLGLAWVTELAGLSLALGAFMAGMLISETEYRYQVEDYIKPFRDVLLGLFFVTIGMLLDMAVIVDRWILVALVLLALVTLKFFIIFALSRFFGSDRAVAMRSALALAPAGEFGFVLLSLAGGVRLLAPDTLQVVLAAMLISMLATPLILINTERIVLKFSAGEWDMRAMALHDLSVKSMATRGHVIICGYGRSGQSLARFLEKEDIRSIALDSDPQRVRQAAAAGESVVFGDAGRREVLTAAGLPRAAAVVVSFADTARALSILSHVHALRPDIPVIVRTFDDTDIDVLRKGGATEIVAEVVEGSLMLATQTMLLLGSPPNRVLRRLREVRGERYEFMRGFFPGATDVDDPEFDSSQPRLQSFMLEEGAAAVGKTIAKLDLDAAHARITAVRRRGVRHVNPAGEFLLEAGDVLIVAGTPEALGKAEIALLQGA
ncbi:MAG: monovalent cation:proton antiporter-2 (CPA2) family protein [Burkholderiales bacterium]|nr:monovalent cation:proton antiporter-2 (CPA2) family protein [Burkholderiales bacterium]